MKYGENGGIIAIENPIPHKFAKNGFLFDNKQINGIGNYSQIIQPYQFGHTERKQTCLWLKGLPLLLPTEIVEPELYTYRDGRTDGLWHVSTMKLPKEERSKARSITFPGIAKAMAEQWGNI